MRASTRSGQHTIRTLCGRAVNRPWQKYLSITPEQRRPGPYSQSRRWYAPYRSMRTPTKSQPFMEFLEQVAIRRNVSTGPLERGLVWSAVGAYSRSSHFAPDDEQEGDSQSGTLRRTNSDTFRGPSSTVLAISPARLDNCCQLRNRETLSRSVGHCLADTRRKRTTCTSCVISDVRLR